jgi:hypothetical protein
MRHRPQPIGKIIRRGEDGEHPRRGGCGPHVDAGNVGMGMRRAQDISVDLPRQRQIVGIAAEPDEQALVFAPPDRVSDASALRSRNAPLGHVIVLASAAIAVSSAGAFTTN